MLICSPRPRKVGKSLFGQLDEMNQHFDQQPETLTAKDQQIPYPSNNRCRRRTNPKVKEDEILTNRENSRTQLK
jgi:hypothetical protein